eukprot:TRINITY_DN95715_c0_g1_i1.p1 TRINITY_DN95715_c0_g1~~TRINITY_DN95715_c0_g1_i1.p1  ORF type:complete len:276 (-),score=25.66 TRINITY_DN95715_c0_g1_i1:430-1257(-)
MGTWKLLAAAAVVRSASSSSSDAVAGAAQRDNGTALESWKAAYVRAYSCRDKRGLYMLKCLGFEPQVVLDIGANIGDWTRRHRVFFPSASFFLVDADRWWSFWKDLMQGERVNATVAVLGPQRKLTPWYGSTFFHTGNSMFKETTHFFREIPRRNRLMLSLDSLLKVKGWPSTVDLMKIDVQGGELEVLKGATQVLQYVSALLMELPFGATYNDGAPRFAEYIAFMDTAGFAPFDLHEVHLIAGLAVQIDILFVRKTSPWAQLANDAMRGFGAVG